MPLKDLCSLLLSRLTVQGNKLSLWWKSCFASAISWPWRSGVENQVWGIMTIFPDPLHFFFLTNRRGNMATQKTTTAMFFQWFCGSHPWLMPLSVFRFKTNEGVAWIRRVTYLFLFYWLHFLGNWYENYQKHRGKPHRNGSTVSMMWIFWQFLNLNYLTQVLLQMRFVLASTYLWYVRNEFSWFSIPQCKQASSLICNLIHWDLD